MNASGGCRAPPCTRRGASRPPDPGTTPEQKSGSASGTSRARNRFLVRASCRTRGSSPTNVQPLRPVLASCLTRGSSLSRLPTGSNSCKKCAQKYEKGVTGKLPAGFGPSPRRNRHPPRLQKFFKRKWGGLVGVGVNFLYKFSPSPLQFFLSRPSPAWSSSGCASRTTDRAHGGPCARWSRCKIRRPPASWRRRRPQDGACPTALR